MVLVETGRGCVKMGVFGWCTFVCPVCLLLALSKRHGPDGGRPFRLLSRLRTGLSGLGGMAEDGEAAVS